MSDWKNRDEHLGLSAAIMWLVVIFLAFGFVQCSRAEPREVAHEVCITPEQVAENYRRVPGLWHVWELKREHIELLRTGLDEAVEGDSGIVAERPDIQTAQVVTFLNGCALGRYMMDREALEQALTSKML